MRQQVEAALGAPVARAARSGVAIRLHLLFGWPWLMGDGLFSRRLTPIPISFRPKPSILEARVYQELGGLLANWVAQYYATIAHEDRHGLVLEDLGPKSVPPWTPALARRITHALAGFHRATLRRAVARVAFAPSKSVWPLKAGSAWSDESQGFQKLAAMGR